MANIVTVGGEQRISLLAEEFVRTFSFGGDWSNIHVAMRVAINGVANTTSYGFFVGLCVGTTYTYRSANCIAWLGQQIGLGNLTYNAGPPSYYSFPSSTRFATKVGAVQTNYDSSTWLCNLAASGSGNRSYFGMNFWKQPSPWGRTSSTTILTQTQTPTNAAAAQADCSNSEYWTLCESQAAQAKYYAPSRITNTVPAAAYDTLSIWWADPAISLEISDIMVMRFG